MEKYDRERILKACKVDDVLQELYEEHSKIEKELSKLTHRKFLTSDEELREKELKVKKLKGVDKMINRVARQEANA